MLKRKQCLTYLKKLSFLIIYLNLRLKSARLKVALYILPKVIDKIRNPILPAIENVDDSSDLEGQGVKIIIPTNIIDIYTRLEVLLGLKISSHTDTLTEASHLIDKINKRGELSNEQQYRNALDKFVI